MEARGRGGARPRVGRYLDGGLHLMGGGGGYDLTPGPSPTFGEGWIPAFAGLCVPGSATERGVGGGGVLVGVWVGQGAGIGRVVGQALLAQPGVAGRQGDGGNRHGTQTVLTRRPGRGGRGYVSTRCPRGGTRTARPRRGQGGAGSLLTRCQKGGTQTVLTRRLGRDGRGYVSTRCPRGGTRTARPRRAQGGVGSLMTRCQKGGTQTMLTRRLGRGGRGYVSTRCPRGGTQTAMLRRAG